MTFPSLVNKLRHGHAIHPAAPQPRREAGTHRAASPRPPRQRPALGSPPGPRAGAGRCGAAVHLPSPAPPGPAPQQGRGRRPRAAPHSLRNTCAGAISQVALRQHTACVRLRRGGGRGGWSTHNSPPGVPAHTLLRPPSTAPKDNFCFTAPMSSFYAFQAFFFSTREKPSTVGVCVFVCVSVNATAKLPLHTNTPPPAHARRPRRRVSWACG